MTTKSQAYEAFNTYLQNDPPQVDIAALLANPATEHRGSLCGALADRETLLTSPALLDVMRATLTDQDVFTRRMAALALFGGGPDGEAVLEQEMGGKLPKEIAVDFIELFRIASGVAG